MSPFSFSSCNFISLLCSFLQHLVISYVLWSLHFVLNHVQSTFFTERQSLKLSQHKSNFYSFFYFNLGKSEQNKQYSD
jgi:hypothetical protein